MSAEEPVWWPPVVDTPSEGQKLPAPRPIEKKPAKLPEYRIPDRVTATWVEQQLPKTQWKSFSKNCSLNPHMIASMSADIRKGIPPKYVMARCGMSMATWNMWVKKAVEGQQPYLLWYQAIQASAGTVVAEVLDSVLEQALAGDLKSAQMILKTIDKDEFSDKPTSNVTINGGIGNQNTSVNHLPDDQVVDLAQILLSLGVNSLESPVIEGEVIEDENHDTDA